MFLGCALWMAGASEVLPPEANYRRQRTLTEPSGRSPVGGIYS